MPTLEFNKKDLLSYLGKKMTDKELAHAITYLGVNCEHIDKTTVKAEVFPNRPDLLSESGMARALRSYLGIETGFKTYKVLPAKHKVLCDKQKVRPYTSCCIVRGLKLTKDALDEIIQVQEKLHITFGRKRQRCAIGIYPIEHITFPITYTAKSPNKITFTPLDAKQPMSATQILTTHPKGKEFAHLLEGQDKYPVFIDAKNTILSMPPIINSEEAGRVTEKTKDVFIECSGFNVHTLDTCLAIVATMMTSYGGTIEALEVQHQQGNRTLPQLEPKIITLDTNYAQRRAGFAIKNPKALLEQMGYGIKKQTKTSIEVKVPAYREDVLHQIDIVEDLIVAHGYDNIEPIYRPLGTPASTTRMVKLQDKISDLLVGLGLLEASTFVLNSIKNQDQQMHGDKKILDHIVPINNPTSEEYDALRAWLTPSLMGVLQSNKDHPYPQKLFTQGRVVIQTQALGIKEEERTAFALCGDKFTYTDAKQHMEYILNRCGLDSVTIRSSDHPSFIKGRCGRITINNKAIGFIGEIHPQAIVNHGLQYPVVACELIMDKIIELL